MYIKWSSCVYRIIGYYTILFSFFVSQSLKTDTSHKKKIRLQWRETKQGCDDNIKGGKKEKKKLGDFFVVLFLFWMSKCPHAIKRDLFRLYLISFFFVLLCILLLDDV